MQTKQHNRITDVLFYYFSVVAPIIFYILLFYFLFTNNNSTDLQSNTGRLWFSLKFIWFTSVIISISNLLGLILYGSPHTTDQINLTNLENEDWNPLKKLKIIYVSRGDNKAALNRAVVQTVKVLNEYDVNYQIDIVTDIAVSKKIINLAKLRFHVVPKSYFTLKGARYKARALHYVIEHNTLPKKLAESSEVWNLHLDEESTLTPQCLAGIAKFINNPKNKKAVGQGEIKYNAHKFGDHLAITAIDAVRTGDDLGRFRFQYKFFQKPVFGMHGSYFLVPDRIEQKIGFDLGGRGSITEDAYFALHASEKNIPFRWVDGYIREQSPFTLSAILKQRRRWYCGLKYLAFDSNLKFKTRLPLMLNVILWTSSWMGSLLTLLNTIHPNGYSPIWVTMPAAVVQGSYAGVYLVGIYRQLIDVEFSIIKKIWFYIITFVFIPFSSLIEGLAIFYGLIRPVKTFDVVKK